MGGFDQFVSDIAVVWGAAELPEGSIPMARRPTVLLQTPWPIVLMQESRMVAPLFTAREKAEAFLLGLESGAWRPQSVGPGLTFVEEVPLTEYAAPDPSAAAGPGFWICVPPTPPFARSDEPTPVDVELDPTLVAGVGQVGSGRVVLRTLANDPEGIGTHIKLPATVVGSSLFLIRHRAK